MNKIGGYKEVYSREEVGNMGFEIKFRNPDIDGLKQPLITYELQLGLNEFNQPQVVREILRYRKGKKGRPYKFLDFPMAKEML